MAGALFVIAMGMIYATLFAIVGGVLVILAMFGWAPEPSESDTSDSDPEPDDTPGAELARVGGDS